MGEWPLVALADVAATEQSAISKPYGSAIFRTDYVESGIPVVRGVNLARGRFHDDDFVYIDEAVAARMPGAHLRAGDLVFTHRGSIGQVSMIPRAPRFPRYVASTSQVKVRLDADRTMAEFYFYWFQGRAGQNSILERASVVGVPGLARPVESVKALRVPLPPLEEQRRIAGVLGALDDLIGANRGLNSALACLQLAIFARDWDGEYRVRLAGVAEVTMGQSPPGDTYNESGEGTVFYQGTRDFGWRFPGRRVWTTQPTRLARASDILVSVRAPVGDVNVATEDTALGRGVGALRARRRPSTLLQALLVDTQLWDMHQGTGTVFASINRAGMENLMVPWVESDDLESTLEVIDDAILQLTREAEELVHARDELLPLLMSGRLRVSEDFEVA